MKRQIPWATVAAVALALWATPAATQTNEEFKALRKDVEQIQKDLQEIKGLLRARPAAGGAAAAPQEITLDLADQPSKGAKTAKITMVEITDYQ